MPNYQSKETTLLDKLLSNVHEDYRCSVLNKGASDSEISETESKIGVEFPEVLKKLYREANGENGTLLKCLTRPCMIFDEFEFLSLEKVAQEHDFYMQFAYVHKNEEEDRKIATEILEGSVVSNPPGHIKLSYFNKCWIPIGWGGTDLFVAVDMDPDTLGKKGQIILFGGMILPDLLLAAPNLIQFIDDVANFTANYQLNNNEEEANYLGLIYESYR